MDNKNKRLSKVLKVGRMTEWRWLNGKSNASYKNAKRIVKALKGNPNNLKEVFVWMDGGDVKKRKAMFNAWASNNK